MTLLPAVFISLTAVQRSLSTSKSDWGVSSTSFLPSGCEWFDFDQFCFAAALPFCFFTDHDILESQHEPPILPRFSRTTQILQCFGPEPSWGSSQPQPAWLTRLVKNWSNHSEVRKEISPGTHFVIFPFSFSLDHLEGDTCQEIFRVMMSAENRGQLPTFLFSEESRWFKDVLMFSCLVPFPQTWHCRIV